MATATYSITPYVRTHPRWVFWKRTKIAHIYCNAKNCDFFMHVIEPCTEEDWEILNLEAIEHQNKHNKKPKKKSTKKS